MRRKKIKGHNRRHRQIEKWRLENCSLDLASFLKETRNYYYAKIMISPWYDLSGIKSAIPQPNKKTRQKMLNGLLNIYDNWKSQLGTIGQPYYLKIWLFEPRFAKSQVVCAIGNRINFYEHTFYKPDNGKMLNTAIFGALKQKAEKLSWDYCLDEEHFDNSELQTPEDYATPEEYEEAKRWFAKLLKKPHRLTQFSAPIGNATESYSIKKGIVWVGR